MTSAFRFIWGRKIRRLLNLPTCRWRLKVSARVLGLKINSFSPRMLWKRGRSGCCSKLDSILCLKISLLILVVLNLLLEKYTIFFSCAIKKRLKIIFLALECDKSFRKYSSRAGRAVFQPENESLSIFLLQISRNLSIWVIWGVPLLDSAFATFWKRRDTKSFGLIILATGANSLPSCFTLLKI